MAENNFANWAERAIGPSMTPTERATIWATLAVAYELSRIADTLAGARVEADAVLDANPKAMAGVAFDADDFHQLSELQRTLINKERAMTFDEQRDFAESLRVLLDRAVK
jgi:hypothetical protein